MTGEIEKISNGTFNVVGELRPIAVSTANVTPESNGIAPLEKQSAFIQEQIQQTANVSNNESANQTEVAPNLVQDAPQLSAEAPVENNSVQDITNETETLSNPIEEMNIEETVPQQGLDSSSDTLTSIDSDAIDSIDYQKTNDGEILTNPAVDAVGTADLDKMNMNENINNFVNNVLGGNDPSVTPDNTVNEEIQKMELPTMDQEINAQEPIGQDDRLFEGISNTNGSIEQQNYSVSDTPFAIPTIEATAVSEDKQIFENPMVDSSENKIESSNLENLQSLDSDALANTNEAKEENMESLTMPTLDSQNNFLGGVTPGFDVPSFDDETHSEELPAIDTANEGLNKEQELVGNNFEVDNDKISKELDEAFSIFKSAVMAIITPKNEDNKIDEKKTDTISDFPITEAIGPELMQDSTNVADVMNNTPTNQIIDEMDVNNTPISGGKFGL